MTNLDRFLILSFATLLLSGCEWGGVSTKIKQVRIFAEGSGALDQRKYICGVGVACWEKHTRRIVLETEEKLTKNGMTVPFMRQFLRELHDKP